MSTTTRGFSFPPRPLAATGADKEAATFVSNWTCP